MHHRREHSWAEEGKTLDMPTGTKEPIDFLAPGILALATMTLPTRLCSLRQREARLANRLSKNWTLVVTMMGASQFSLARQIGRAHV